MALIYSLARPGSPVISTACLFVFDGCRRIVVRQSSFGSLSILNLHSQPEARPQPPAKLRPHNGPPQPKAVTVAVAPGTGPRSTYSEKRGRKLGRAGRRSQGGGSGPPADLCCYRFAPRSPTLVHLFIRQGWIASRKEHRRFAECRHFPLP